MYSLSKESMGFGGRFPDTVGKWMLPKSNMTEGRQSNIDKQPQLNTIAHLNKFSTVVRLLKNSGHLVPLGIT